MRTQELIIRHSGTARTGVYDVDAAFMLFKRASQNNPLVPGFWQADVVWAMLW